MIKKIMDNTMSLDKGAITEEVRSKLSRQVFYAIPEHYTKSIGWTYQGSSYCQLIREATKAL